MPESETEILTEFQSVLNDAAGAHLAAISGLELWRRRLLELTADAPNPEADFIAGHGPPVHPETLGYQRWPIGSLDERLSAHGPVAEQLSRQWAVFIYAEWEHVYRPRIAAARGVDLSEVRDDLMGDIRHIRNDIVHHAGTATPGHCGRCVVLHWFESEDRILITTEHVAEFMGHVGLTYPT